MKVSGRWNPPRFFFQKKKGKNFWGFEQKKWLFFRNRMEYFRVFQLKLTLVTIVSNTFTSPKKN